MPYIAIKAWPKDKEAMQKIVEQINETVLKAWGCPREAVSISFEPVPKEEWEEKVRNAVILPNKDKMMILDGEKQY